MTWARLAACAAILVAAPVQAGLHLGMKLACKRYGDALNSGNRSGLLSVCTEDFGRQWARIPSDVFSQLARNSGGQVLSSTKDGNAGTVTVSSSQGTVTFVLIGGGFDWRVADIFKPGDDGAMLSVKSYLDATLTVNELMANLKRQGGGSFHRALSKNFLASFQKLAPHEVARVRDILPDPKVKALPRVRLGDSRATVRTRLPDSCEGDCITFYLVQENGWKVDDFELKTRGTQIASFRTAMPLLIGVAGFGEFVRWPETRDPKRFTIPGDLRDALEYARTQPLSLGKPQKPREFVVAADCQSVNISYGDRQIRLTASDEPGMECRLEAMAMRMAGSWSDVAHMLLMKRNVASTANWLQTWATTAAAAPTDKAVPRALPSTTVVVAKPRASDMPSTNRATEFVKAEEKPRTQNEAPKTAAKPTTSSRRIAAATISSQRGPIRAAAYRATPSQMSHKESVRGRRR